MCKESIHNSAHCRADSVESVQSYNGKLRTRTFPAHFNKKALNSHQNNCVLSFICNFLWNLNNLLLQQNRARARAMSNQGHPVIYAGQVPDYTGKNQNSQNVVNVFRSRSHSTKSEPFNLLKRNSGNSKKLTLSSSEEVQKIKREIQSYRAMLGRIYVKREQFEEKHEIYERQIMKATQKRDKEQRSFWMSLKSQCMEQMKDNIKLELFYSGEITSREQKLEKLQDKKI